MAKVMTVDYELDSPISMGEGNDPITKIVLHKPNFGELAKVKATHPYGRALEMVVACSDQPLIVIKRMEYEDVQELTEEVLPDFLEIEAPEEA